MKKYVWSILFILFIAITITAVIISPPFSTVQIVYAADCSNTSINALPLTDLSTDTYFGAQGGLYPNGQNIRPSAHDKAGLAIASTIQPLNALGQPDPNGIIVVASVGMSNNFQEFGTFEDIAATDPDINPLVAFANLGNPGVVSQRMADPNDLYWTNRVPKALEKLKITYQQVQVIWLKNNRGYPDESFPEFGTLLQEDLTNIVQIANNTFPNLKMIYLSSRIYGGYSTDDLNPEPYSYQSGFGVKWLIEAQINGDPALNYDFTNGSVEAPWLAWGPYMWADGLTPRSDGLVWRCSDLEEDGVHPSDIGEEKVATFLLNFFKTDSTSKSWFGEGNPLPPPPPPGSGGSEVIFLPLLAKP